MRNILLIEPNYSNKYPPIGLMKIATYHRMLGDKVSFFKGDLNSLALDIVYQECLEKLQNIDNSISWHHKQNEIKQYIKTKKIEFLDSIGIKNTENEALLKKSLDYYADFLKKKKYNNNPIYDRIYVTTLFTFYWKITVETINFCKPLVKNPDQIMIGGVLASLLHKELEAEVGIKPMQGLLDKAGQLDPKNKIAKNIIIDNLPLDYSILDEVDYEYPTRSAYFTFMTKGCTRKCAFCSVPILEPTYKPKIETIDKFKEVNDKYGEQQHLLLMDNNVLASPKFSEIIDEIKAMGFYKGATFVEPNQLEIAVKNLQSGYNDSSFIRRTYRLIHELLQRLQRFKNENVAQIYYDLLAKYQLLKFETTTKDNLLLAHSKIGDIYEKYRNKTHKLRYVDFNQGTDCRYVTEELMQKMSEIPIYPLRIAFDYIGLEKQYTSAVRLAAKYGIKELSNYILYNFHDTPEDLYNRLKINANLCQELDVAIFSFPMKYIPLFGEEAKHRNHTGKHWNKKFIRAVQSILNVTKGIVAPSNGKKGDSFFYEAFGKDIQEFKEILYMPETYIVYRHLFRYKLDYTSIWENEYRNLCATDLQKAQEIIGKNDFSIQTIQEHEVSDKVIHFLRHYTLLRGNIDKEDNEYKKLKTKFDKLIKSDQFIDLTLTYDFS